MVLIQMLEKEREINFHLYKRKNSASEHFSLAKNKVSIK